MQVLLPEWRDQVHVNVDNTLLLHEYFRHMKYKVGHLLSAKYADEI